MNENQVYIAFTLQTFSPTTYPEGAYIDDIVLRKCVYTSCTGAPPYEKFSLLQSPAIKDFLQPFLQQLVGYGSQLLPH